jgi:hypothetical protein
MEKIRYSAGFKYQLAEDFPCQVDICPVETIITEYIGLTNTGLLTIKKGYAWDGCSGPTWDDKSNMRAGLIHDALYQLIREKYLSPDYRDDADRELLRFCIKDGMMSFRAWYYYFAVRKFAGFAAAPRNQKKILTAP